MEVDSGSDLSHLSMYGNSNRVANWAKEMLVEIEDLGVASLIIDKFMTASVLLLERERCTGTAKFSDFLSP